MGESRLVLGKRAADGFGGFTDKLAIGAGLEVHGALANQGRTQVFEVALLRHRNYSGIRSQCARQPAGSFGLFPKPCPNTSLAQIRGVRKAEDSGFRTPWSPGWHLAESLGVAGIAPLPGPR